MDLLECLVSQQGLFGTVADFCMSAITFSLLSVISLLTYFDVLESFSLFHWLFKVGICYKKRAPDSDDVTTGAGLCSLTCYSDAKRASPVQTLSSVAERVMLLESDLSRDDTDQCNNPIYRKIFTKLLREINHMDHVLQRLWGQCTAAERDPETLQNSELNRGTKDLPHSPWGNTQQSNTKVGDMVTARDRRRIQLLSSKLQSMKIYIEQRLQLLNSFTSCYESYQLSYYQLHDWVVRTSKFQEWIHSVECDSKSLIIKNLSYQKKIVEEIEERAPQLGNCQRTVTECVQVFKQIELHAASFKPNLKQDQHLADVKSKLPSTFPSSIHQEFTDLRQQFVNLVRLTRCYVTHLRDLLKMRHKPAPFTMRTAERQRQSGIHSSPPRQAPVTRAPTVHSPAPLRPHL